MERREDIKTDEGYMSVPYLCSENYLSWLWGRNLETNPITKDEWDLLKTIISSGGNLKDWANKLFEIEVLKVEESLLTSFPEFSEMPEEVQVILINMRYNMGSGRFNRRKWPGLFRALKGKDWKEASKEMIDSKWFYQVGQRSVRLATSMEGV